jgi:hypothetical protein
VVQQALGPGAQGVASHAYLGETDDVGGGGGGWLAEGARAALPLLPVTDLVLLPGQVLPLKLIQPSQKRWAGRAAAPGGQRGGPGGQRGAGWPCNRLAGGAARIRPRPPHRRRLAPWPWGRAAGCGGRGLPCASAPG